jgi:hypothetical protein
MGTRRIIARVLAITTFGAMIATTSVGFAGASSGSRSARLVASNRIRYLGTTNVATLGKHSHQASASSDTRRAGGLKLPRRLSPKGPSLLTAPSAGPDVKGLPVRTASSVQPYDGVNAADSRLARGGNQYTNAPPDGGVCSGKKGIVVETVNSAFGFFDNGGDVLFPPIAQTSFFGLPPSIDRTTSPPTFPGPSVGDPKCMYDAGTGRMILLTWGTGQDPTSGAWDGTNTYFIAVARSKNVLGNYNLYALELDPPNSSGCDPACLSDHPTLSTDANTIVTTYNKYNAGTGDYLGAVIIAFSKSAMEAGDPSPNVVTIDAGSLGGGLLYTLQGASAPAGGSDDTSNGGTMWFLSALQFVFGQADDRVAVEALMNTSAIDTNPNQIVYQAAVVQGNHRYDSPPVTPQKKGPFPLGKSVGEKLNYLDSGSDEMQPVWYAGGQLWGILDSRVGSGATLRGGLLWMTVKPTGSGAGISGTVTHAQFVSVETEWLDYGAIAVNGAGTKAIVVASWAGKDVYPSSVYGWLDTKTWKVSSLTAYLMGVRPVDDFDCYAAFNPDFARGCRFGDYNGAALDKSGKSFTLESEYVSARPRVSFANWGTGLATAKI